MRWPWHWPRTYTTSMINTTHYHWMEYHGNLSILDVSGISRTWDTLPRYGDWSVTANGMRTGGANCSIVG